jgi:hypothetical protein
LLLGRENSHAPRSAPARAGSGAGSSDSRLIDVNASISIEL